MGGGERWKVQVLGPIRVLDPTGAEVTPDGALQRRLLALLVLGRDRVVSVDAAVDALWPGDPPRDPLGALQNHVSRLRRSLPEGLIVSSGDGYRLSSSGIDLDADRLVAQLHEDRLPPGNADELAALLDRWHGPAFAELLDVDEGRAESSRLAELQIRARELHAEHRLAAGQADDVVSELAALAEAEPLRERPRALLMAALDATGRRVDALRVYDDFRRLLGDELGIEPSPVLVAQHAALLDRDVEEARWVPSGGLPTPTTSLIGRSSLVDEVTTLVGSRRLVTLLGPGGVGKTRMSLEVGQRLAHDRPDRPVVLCELATAAEHTALDVVAAALGIDARPGVPTAERVASVLDDTEVVVVLDNCEHVLDPIAELAERLITRCEHVTLLATSRERLRVPGEQVCTVPPLRLDATGGHSHAEAAPDGEVQPDIEAPAVRLFVDRARAVVPGFDPDAADLACIAEIVGHLDGLPLAIELAGARLLTHDIREIANGLDHRFELLTTGSRSSPRHGSLHAAVAWSYGLLDARLQSTFAELSIFAGSFSAADAAAVGATSTSRATSALAELTERSLLTRTPDRRYSMLETLRAFGAEQLARDGRVEQVVERHARHQVDWIEQADRDLVDPDRPTIAEIDAALPELRAALDRLLERHQVDQAGRLVAALLNYGFLRLRPDVLAWSELVIAADPGDVGHHAAGVWVVAAYAAWMAGDTTLCGERAAHARGVEERAGREPGAEVAEISGSHALFEGRLEESLRWYELASDQAATSGDHSRWLMMQSTELLALGYAGDDRAAELAARLLASEGARLSAPVAYLWYCAGEAEMSRDPASARTRFLRAIEIGERTTASFVVGVAGASLASIDARIGDPYAAAEEYRRLIEHWRRAGMWATQWTMLRSIAGLLARLDRPRDAAVLAGAIWATESGHRIFGADEVALGELGDELRDALGATAYLDALTEGAALDGDAAVDHALRTL